MKSPKYSAKDEMQLMADLWSPEIKDNPLAFVMYAYPWGKANSPLANYTGPRSWQKEELLNIAKHIQENKLRVINKKPMQMYRSATASGRGVGKSALVAWLTQWFISTRIGATAIVTANTETQLKSRTWAEMGKWHSLLINEHWFEKTAMSLRPHQWFEAALKEQLQGDTGYYYAAAQTYSEERPDAFAGVHNDKGILLLFDEASGIPSNIWTVSEGFFTEPIEDRYWFCFSNPRRNTGEFYECFFKNRQYWARRNLDSRFVEGTDHALLEGIVKRYGEDSDEARIEVKGEFPSQGDKQFISRDVVSAAVLREIDFDEHAPLIMGVDPARYGDDKTVIRFRQGRHANMIPPIKLKKLDNMEVAAECAHLIQKYNPQAVCIDAGNGTGIIDRLRELGHKVHEVWFGGGSERTEWGNKRTELWAKMRDWLQGGVIDSDKDLMDDLVGPEYNFMANSDKMILEPKEKMKKRGLASPDDADALACTFAVNPSRSDVKTHKEKGTGRVARDVDYDFFSR